ncbi:hypothetical protein MJO29_010534 [Puccinia striiformis f. sp. tritici]|uniref:Uncharacterized protein n=1 Tax=Puccinia striiformis f. sp. tritici PST-78 TaxID=1165861 RepID=A0A0L0UPR3_9BASI|nr:hypothetical protein MJO29_010534 [Puccinia striiformis f. sp. tritici]KNE88784.1 hypothetical protein PSTG_17791 [Puccinia striiformis f. sp. tritici PST-78]
MFTLPLKAGRTSHQKEGNQHPAVNNQPDTVPCAVSSLYTKGVSDDIYAPDLIKLLQIYGLNFKRHEAQGIDPSYFGELLTSSGLVLLKDVKFDSFHSGYTFGYILKTVTLVLNMPVSVTQFFHLLKNLFPCIYGIKFLMRSWESLTGKFNKVAKDLNVYSLLKPWSYQNKTEEEEERMNSLEEKTSSHIRKELTSELRFQIPAKIKCNNQDSL